MALLNPTQKRITNREEENLDGINRRIRKIEKVKNGRNEDFSRRSKKMEK